MTGEMGCEQVRELAPELALGIAEGEERDAALRHLTPRRVPPAGPAFLGGDDLLQLAPAHDPPAGFESRVLAGLTEPPRHGSIRPLTRRWQWLAAAAPLWSWWLPQCRVGVPGHGRRSSARRQLPGGPEPGTRSLLPGGPASRNPGPGRHGVRLPGAAVMGDGDAAALDPESRFEVQVVTRDGRYLPSATRCLAVPREPGEDSSPTSRQCTTFGS